LDTEIFEWESRLAADKDLQPGMQTFYRRQNKLRKGIGILMLALKKENGVREVLPSVVIENKSLPLLE
jgi:hypothetical protein